MLKLKDIPRCEDERVRRGVFPTPQIWVEKSQEYLAKVFGDDWQEEYYIWDCCAGTCNLLAGLTEKHRIWASTIDQPDVNIVHELIAKNEFNLLAKHVFQFDFLNDDFAKLPKSLRDIINDPEKRKKLIVYMNPPYAEARGQQVGKSNKKGFHLSKTRDKYLDEIGKAAIEMFTQFAIRIYSDLPDAKLAMFSKLKYVNAPNFERFRGVFKATYKNGFIVPANTFDNVKGRFPIGFLIWDLEDKKTFKQIKTDVLDRTGRWKGTKTHYCCDKKTPLINVWVKTFAKTENSIATIIGPAADFQHQSTVWILAPYSDSHWFHWQIGKENLLDSFIYFAIRHCIEATWVNDRDQFLYPNDTYTTDKEFHTDCLIFTLLHHQNRIRSHCNTNHWIPFTAKEVDAKDNFRSAFMSDFLKTRKKMSKEAKAVFAAGKALWKYYHQTIKTARRAVVDASLYEIREYFKGRDEKGRMKTKATDERFNELDAALRLALKKLAEKIQPKVYEYGFLRK